MVAREAPDARKAGKSKGQLRRRVIIRALHDLILSKGYAETSLSDLAGSVGMSVSHLLYYFDSKEAVLEELCRKLNSRFLAEITAASDDSPEQRVAALVDHIFTGGGRPRQAHRLTVEMVALSMHRPKIREIITEFNDQWTACLTNWFEEIPRPSGISAEDAAVRVRAVLTGLVNNTQFDARLDQRRVRRLFREAILDILGVSSSHRQMGGQRPRHAPDGKEPRQMITRSSS